MGWLTRRNDPIKVETPAPHVYVKIHAMCADGVPDTRRECVEVQGGDVQASVAAHVLAHHSHVTVRRVEVSAAPFPWGE